MNLIDLDKEGLQAYKHLLNRKSSVTSVTEAHAALSKVESTHGESSLVSSIFSTINLNKNGRVSREEAEKIILKLNSRFGRAYGENEVNMFFGQLDTNSDGSIDLEEFKAAFIYF